MSSLRVRHVHAAKLWHVLTSLHSAGTNLLNSSTVAIKFVRDFSPRLPLRFVLLAYVRNTP